jgi:hypothetical protein
LKSGLKTGQRAAKQPSADKPQNHASAATPPKSAKLHANTFNIFNFKKWPVTASGLSRGVSGGWREILRICKGNSDMNFIEENQNLNIQQIFNTRILAGKTEPSEL